jgi:gliding motility-associated-like protein
MHYSSGTFYDTLVAASYLSCDSILTTALTVISRPTGTVNTSICSPRTVFLGGALRSSSGTYYDTLFARASSGCDSIVMTNLTVIPRSLRTQNVSICDGNILRVGRSRYTVAGTYFDTLVASSGCDSIITTNLSIIPVITQTQSARLCAGQNILVNGHRYTSTGTYYDTLLSRAGCDSFVITNLIVDTMSAGDINITFCQGESSRFGGTTYSTAGLYYDTATDIRGCDSLLRIHVTVLTRPVTNLNPSVCAGQTYTVHGITYSSAGTYYDTLVAFNGCDSILHITLTVLPLANRTLNQSICSGDTFRIAGVSYTSTGSYFDTLTAANGCDSILHLNLLVNTPVSALLSRNICEGTSIRIGTHTYNTAGTYFDTITGSNGCDSMIRTDLSIIPTMHASQTVNLCDGQTLHIGIHTYGTTGVYWDTLRSSLGCDSILNTNLTVHLATTITSDTTFCDGDIYNGVVYHSPTTLHNTLSSSLGCDSIIYVVNIHIIPNLPLTVSHDTIICPGDAVQLHASGGSGSYIWSPSFGLSCDHCPDPISQPGSPVSYVVVSTNCQGLPITDNVTVDIAPSLGVSVNFQDTTIYFGQQVTIYAAPSHAADIHWLQLDSTLCTNCPELTFMPHVDGMYTAVATDQYNCKAQDSLFIHLQYGCGDSLIDIPNILTPNGDGANDLWYVKNPQNLYIYDVQVYDRWGELIFESYKANNPWDGTYQGAVVVPGVYTYAVDGRCAYGRLWQRKGNITVIK